MAENSPNLTNDKQQKNEQIHSGYSIKDHVMSKYLAYIRRALKRSEYTC